MRPISPNDPYDRLLCVDRVKPSHIRPPLCLTILANAQSSITVLRIVFRPPACLNDCGLIRMQPPAAPAVFDWREAIHAGGYNMKKKKTNAGIRVFSAKLSHESFTMYEAMSYPPPSAISVSSATLEVPCTISASVNSR